MRQLAPPSSTNGTLATEQHQHHHHQLTTITATTTATNTRPAYRASELGRLTTITTKVYWDSQSITGTLPTELGSLSSLESYLHAYKNLMDGPIPSEVSV